MCVSPFFVGGLAAQVPPAKRLAAAEAAQERAEKFDLQQLPTEAAEVAKAMAFAHQAQEQAMGEFAGGHCSS